MFPMTKRTTSATLLCATAFAAPAMAMAPAHAQGQSGSRGVQATGHCVGGGTWKLKAKHDAGRIVAEFEVDTNRAGQVWLVGVTDNRVRIFLHHRRTLAPSGSFTVRVVTANRAGIDTIRARSTMGARSCTGAVRL